MYVYSSGSEESRVQNRSQVYVTSPLRPSVTFWKKTISCAVVFSVTLWTKTISDQQRGNFLRYIKKEDEVRLPTRQHVWISYCKVYIRMSNLILLSLMLGRCLLKISCSLPQLLMLVQLSIYRTISPSIHPYVNPSVSRSLHPSSIQNRIE
jgi:hypothetical protein